MLVTIKYILSTNCRISSPDYIDQIVKYHDYFQFAYCQSYIPNYFYISFSITMYFSFVEYNHIMYPVNLCVITMLFRVSLMAHTLNFTICMAKIGGSLWGQHDLHRRSKTSQAYMVSPFLQNKQINKEIKL